MHFLEDAVKLKFQKISVNSKGTGKKKGNNNSISVNNHSTDINSNIDTCTIANNRLTMEEFNNMTSSVTYDEITSIHEKPIRKCNSTEVTELVEKSCSICGKSDSGWKIWECSQCLDVSHVICTAKATANSTVDSHLDGSIIPSHGSCHSCCKQYCWRDIVDRTVTNTISSVDNMCRAMNESDNSDYEDDFCNDNDKDINISDDGDDSSLE